MSLDIQQLISENISTIIATIFGSGSLYGLNGQMKFLKIFNYPLSPSEITNLYNKTM